ncbi:DUF3566 domain-containing protein [Actinomadura nitritigenes]|uniref:DUF3566 domain-containing protein n=1 Tax=Actinomadura nitritigenes TaxID=134602 RepID=UPI003D8D6A3E
MSTEPGKSKGGPGGGRSGKGTAGKPAGRPAASGKSGDRTVAAASAKPARDEPAAEVDSDAAAPDGGSKSSSGSSGSDETRVDLAHLKDEPEASGSPEIAPVRDTAEPPRPAKDAARPAKDAGKPSWTKPAEPSGSRSTGRTEKPSVPPPAPAAAAASGGGSGSRPGSGFAGTVLKDRPSAAVAPVNSNAPAQAKPARKAQLQLARLEPWSVMKFSFVMSLVCFVVLLVAVVVLYVILSGLGVFDAISDTVNSLTKQQGDTTGGVDAGNWFSFARVFGYTVLVGALNVLLITALSTVGSVIYNLAADLVGGVEVTLKEAE